MLIGSLFVLVLAQQGDVKGETQPPLSAEILKKTPPSPGVPRIRHLKDGGRAKG